MTDYITIPQLAKILGLSRVAVYKKVKKGEIPSKKAGRLYLISYDYVRKITGAELDAAAKREIEKAVHKTVREYGEVLKMLGDE